MFIKLYSCILLHKRITSACTIFLKFICPSFTIREVEELCDNPIFLRDGPMSSVKFKEKFVLHFAKFLQHILSRYISRNERFSIQGVVFIHIFLF